MEWISDNATWIRDILTPVFSLLLVIVAILVYRRAKETILQPLRSEVVKRQAQKMTELLDFVADTQESDPSDPIDYRGLCSLNAFTWLDEYGFAFKERAKLKEKYESIYGGFIIIKTPDGVIHDVKVLEAIINPSQDTPDDDVEEYRRQKYQKAKAGKFDINDIDKIFLTKRFNEYKRKLAVFIRDPLLPSKILDVLKEFDKSIDNNVVNILRSTIAEFISTFVTESAKTTTKLGMDPSGVYNMFNRKRIIHAAILQKLRINIREHLKVDSTP